MICSTSAPLVLHLGGATFADYQLKSENLLHLQVEQNRVGGAGLSLKNKGCSTAPPFTPLKGGGSGAATAPLGEGHVVTKKGERK